jgi:hypothetical protein
LLSLPKVRDSLITDDCPPNQKAGARKIRELLVRRLDGDIRVPAKSTIHAVLDRHGLVKRGGGPRHRARGTPLSQGRLPNNLWCADFKGEFKLGNGRYCYPLTVTDHASRFLLANETEAVQDGRIHIENINGPFLFRDGGSPAEYGAGLAYAIEKGWLWRHESGTYVKLSQAGADLFA